MSDLKDRVIEAREHAGIESPAALARACKVEPSAIYQVESGKTKSLKAETALLMSRATGFRVEYLVFGKGPKLLSDPVEPFDPDRLATAGAMVIRIAKARAKRLRPEAYFKAAGLIYELLGPESNVPDVEKIANGMIAALTD